MKLLENWPVIILPFVNFSRPFLFKVVSSLSIIYRQFFFAKLVFFDNSTHSWQKLTKKRCNFPQNNLVTRILVPRNTSLLTLVLYCDINGSSSFILRSFRFETDRPLLPPTFKMFTDTPKCHMTSSSGLSVLLREVQSFVEKR